MIARMQRVEQPELDGSRGRIVGHDVAETVAPRPARKPRKISETQLAARARVRAPTNDAVVLACIVSSGTTGRTRPEIATETGVAINAVCGAVGRLLERKSVFEPVVAQGAQGKPVYLQRAACKVLVAAAHAGRDWVAIGKQMAGGAR